MMEIDLLKERFKYFGQQDYISVEDEMAISNRLTSES